MRHRQPPKSKPWSQQPASEWRLFVTAARCTPFPTKNFPPRSNKSPVPHSPRTCPHSTSHTSSTPGGAGVHAAFDGVGKDTFEHSLACLRKRGVCVLFGAASGQVLNTRLSLNVCVLVDPLSACAHRSESPHTGQPVSHSTIIVRMSRAARARVRIIACLPPTCSQSP